MRYIDIIGQKDAVARLKGFGEFFASKGGTPGHILLIGEEGMGKSTIANAFANELGVPFQKVDAADQLNIIGDLTAMLTNLRERQVLLLANLQLLRRPLAELLRGVLRDSKLDIHIGIGASERLHTIDVRPFTLVATCPKKADCPSGLVNIFSLLLTFQPYSRPELQALIENIAKSTGVSLDPRAAKLIARHCDGRPSDVELTLQRLVRAINKSEISEEDTVQAFSAFGLSVQHSDSPAAITDLENLAGEDFEKLIATLLARMGFQTQLTRTTSDGGIDIIATLDKPILGGRYVFQCKRFASDNLVGAPTVRDFYGAVTADRAVKGVFITTSDFTIQAKEFGEKVGLELINMKRLRGLLNEFGAKDQVS